ncbi:MAG TPA: D-aminoacyl-tRNA deacylase [Anaerovoracaceae bacterium]|nr:D-aminoacyl-tRNA deacylase [Anaerovoracaceae bacterium]
MKFVIQRVSEAKVEINNIVVGEIEKGLLVFVGVSNEDTKEIADKMIKKLINMRIFEDSEGKTNLSLDSVDGGLLLVSQFTLYANCKKGNRPSFVDAGKPELAKELYQYIIYECEKQCKKVQKGEFGADMKISLVNEGPFTIELNSKDLN